MSMYADAAEALRKRLRSPDYPELAVGAEISAVAEAQRATPGVSRHTAARAVELLSRQGELLVRPGRLSVVLTEPATAPTEDIDRLLDELSVAVRRQQALLRLRDVETIRRTLAWLDDLARIARPYAAERVFGALRRLADWSPEDELCPLCDGASCVPACPMREIRGSE